MIYQYNRYFINEGSRSSELIHNINSTLQLIETNGYQFPVGESSWDLFEEENDSIDVLRQPWGLLDLWTLSARSGRQSISKSYLTGQKLDSNQLALYLSGSNKPLALCGKTVIKGDVKLPKQGVKRAYIEGQNFIGSKLVDGKIGISSNAILPLHIDAKDRIAQWNSPALKPQNGVILNAIGELRERQGSPDSILVVNANNRLNLLGFEKANWTIFRSSSSIEVPPGISLQNCILIAPSIVFESGFRGNVQCFAHDSILLNKDVILDYPSNLVLSAKRPKSQIRIMESSHVYGSIVVDMKSNLPQKNWARLKLDKEAIATGEVYVNGITEMKGVIEGKLTTRLFYLKTPSSVYENHLLNVTIDRSRLPYGFVNTLSIQNGLNPEIIACVK